MVGRVDGDSLKARCARGSMILGAGAFLAKSLGFVSKMLLTRLLLPQEMGLAVMILSLTALFEVLTEVGIKQSVIQHKDGARPEYLNMAWWFQAVRGIGFYGIAFVLAPWICHLYFQNKTEILSRYSLAEVTWLLRVSFLGTFFYALVSPNAHVLEKRFKFGLATVVMQGGFIVGTIVTIVLAITLRSVWAIAVGFACIGLSRFLLSYILCPYVPRFAYHRESFLALWRFARGMFGLPILTYIGFNMDLLVAGKVAATSAVGIYGMARILAETPRELFVRVVSPVLFPAFAEKQDDGQALCRAVLRLTRATAILFLPLTGFVVLWGGTILSVVYGSREYGTVRVAFGVLCLVNVLMIEGTILASVFFSVGRPEKHRAFVALRAVILAVLIYPALRAFDLNGAAIAVLVATSAALCVQVIVMHRMLHLGVLAYAASWLPGLLLAGVTVVSLLMLGLVWKGQQVLLLVVGVVWTLVVSLGGFWGMRNGSPRLSATQSPGPEGRG
jgi:lipopolysaccharide exporter